MFYIVGVFLSDGGGGTTKMIELCHELKLPEPNFEEYSGGLAVIFRFKSPLVGSPVSVSREFSEVLTSNNKKF